MKDLNRQRYRRTDRTQPAAGREAQGTQGTLCVVFDAGSIPASTKRFVLVHPATLIGPETEGAAATVLSDTSQSFAVWLNKGPRPRVGAVLIAHYVDYRWVAEGGRDCGWRIRSYGCTNTKLVPGNTIEIRQGGVLIDSCVTTLASVEAITVTTSGNSYTSVPTVTISLSPFAAGILTGSGATATAVMQIGSVGRTSGGSGYTNGTFTGTFTGGGPGSGATFTFTVSGGVVQNPTILTRGQGYTSPPTPDFSAAGPGVGATGTTTLNVRSITVTNGGSDYNLEPVVAISGGGGTGANATASLTLPRFSLPAGTYDVTTIPVAGRGQVTSTVSRTWSCSGNTDAVTPLVTAIDGANFACRIVGTYPAPLVMHGTDFQGSFAMTQPSPGFWISDYLSAPDSIADRDCNISSGSYEYIYTLSCPTSAGWQLQIQWRAKCCSNVSYKSDGSGGFDGDTTILGVLKELPFMLTFNLTGYTPRPSLCPTGPGRVVPGHGGTVVFHG